MYRVTVKLKGKIGPYIYKNVDQVRFKNDKWLEIASEKEDILISMDEIEQLSTRKEKEDD